MIYYDGIPEDRIAALTGGTSDTEKSALLEFVRELGNCGLAPRAGRLRPCAPDVRYFRIVPMGSGAAGRGYRAGALSRVSEANLEAKPRTSKASLEGRDRLGAEICALKLAAKPRT